MQKQMMIKLCGVQIYRGQPCEITVDMVDNEERQNSLFTFNPDGLHIGGEEIVRIVEEMSRNGALRIHPNSVKEF